MNSIDQIFILLIYFVHVSTFPRYVLHLYILAFRTYLSFFSLIARRIVEFRRRTRDTLEEALSDAKNKRGRTRWKQSRAKKGGKEEEG